MDPKGFSLQVWQPLVAAIIALGAGALAYHGAMAKVDLERSIHEDEQRRRRQSLLIKLRYAALIFYSELYAIRRRIDPITGQSTETVTVKDFVVRWPPEFQEAWENLDIFGQVEVSRLLANIKHHCNLLEAATAELNQDTTWKYERLRIPPELQPVIKIMEDLESFASDFDTLLATSQSVGLHGWFGRKS
jgi:hypothetical protein